MIFKENWKAARGVLAVLLAFVMLLLIGCDGSEQTSSVTSGSTSSDTHSSSSSESSVGDVSSESSVSENVDSEYVSQNTASINPLLGEFSHQSTTSNINDAFDEIIPVGNTANLSNPLKGYYDKEAEALRQEILNTKNTEEYYKITGTTYYFSSVSGNDSNGGTSPETPLKSVDMLSGLTLNKGDAVLFERGSVFRLYTAILADEGVIYGSYGTGEKPKIYASPMNLAEAEWTPSVKRNVWQMDYSYTDCGSMIFEHGKEIGYKKDSLRNVNKNTYYYLDISSKILYLYCDKGNPAKVYKSIEIATDTPIINVPSGVNDVVVDNLCLKYSGLMAVTGTWNTKNLTVTNCEIGYIGGCKLNGGSRYGNAIQVWTGTENMICDHNWIYQTFDTAISWQGFGGSNFSYENISFSDNLLEYNNADFEFWDPGATLKNFKMEGNIMRFTSLGWGTRADDGGIRGIEGCVNADTHDMVASNISFKNNIMDCPGREIIQWQFVLEELGKTIFVSGNKIHVNYSYRTENEVVKGYMVNKDANQQSKYADTAEEFIEALKIFDPTALLEWN